MIVIGQYPLITLRQAATQIPGRQLCYETVRRWATNGIRGRKLETVRVGGRVCTTMDAIREFVSQLSGPSDVDVPLTFEMQQLQARASLAMLNAELGSRA